MKPKDGIVCVYPAPKPKPTHNGTRCLIEHSEVQLITPAEYERRLAQEGTPLGGVTSRKSPFTTRDSTPVKSGLDFKTSLASCDRALIKMGDGCLISGKKSEDKPLFDRSVPDVGEEA